MIQLARDSSPKAVQTLVKHLDSDNPRTAIAAAVAILDRAFGKPTQTLAGDPDQPLRFAASTLDVSQMSEATLRELAACRLSSEQEEPAND